MPEERNRMMGDAICDKLYTPSSDAVQNLLSENVAIEKIKNVGNIMIDTLIKNLDHIVSKENFDPAEFSLERDYFVLTLHRPINLTDTNLKIIFDAVSQFTKDYDILIPAHPRLRDFVVKNNVDTTKFKVINPQPYIKFLGLVNNSTLCLTDSGGLQEEAAILKKIVLIPRSYTERPELLDSYNFLAKKTNELIKLAKSALNDDLEIKSSKLLYGKSEVTKKMEEIILSCI